MDEQQNDSSEIENDKISAKNKDKICKLSTLLWGYFIGICFTCIGFSYLSEIKSKGYYIYDRNEFLHGAKIHIQGEDGLFTAYGLIIGGVILLIYNIYLTIKRNKTE